MGLNKIEFQKVAGGLGRVAPSEDHISGLIFVDTNASASEIKKTIALSSVEDLENAFVSEGESVFSDYGTYLRDKKKDPNIDAVAATAEHAVHYHVKEFFRMNPTGRLYFGIRESLDSAVIVNFQKSTGGKLRQLGIYDASLSVSNSQALNVASLQAAANELENVEFSPLSILVGAKVTLAEGIQLNTLMDNTGGKNISVLIGESTSELVQKITEEVSFVGCVGTALGAVSKSSVHENIGWVQKFNLGSEFANPALTDGRKVSGISKGALDSLNDKRYIFVIKHVGDAGSYFNDSHVADRITSDFAYIESNRTIDKAVRNVRASLLPQLNAPLTVDPSTGGLAADTIKFFENLAGSPLQRMTNSNELSGYQVGINPDQDVLATSRLEIVLKLVPIGVAREIQVKIGFAAKLS
ncbi:DUF2586 family protein [Aureibacter tunicatorum]|uniref:DUF2586 family protein n=1 Tax=Aureibacter tunicatorum TaxID=866807 RepID=A0AAE3XSE8_9BACT|nr:DUF2586 family protein [Aureibacter tunicatorum]MDR6241893.1 hypothetical protein [Aureibacter tunicatorum]BDD07442.1 hypothetical protein AUTU_49250 [Aureibacter tunicatorum]